MKDLLVGHLNEKEKAEMNRLSAQYQQIGANQMAVSNQFVQYGIAIKARSDAIVKAHKLDPDAIYRYAPNGEIYKVIPDPPPIAGDNHEEEVKKNEEVN